MRARASLDATATNVDLFFIKWHQLHIKVIVANKILPSALPVFYTSISYIGFKGAVLI